MCYNHEYFLIESIESVINQNYKNIQIIIVDDASTDNSVKVIEKWLLQHPDVTFIKNDKNLGNTSSFNKALKLVKGDFVIDLATDDVLLPHSIENQLEVFKIDCHTALVFGNAEIINEEGHFLSYYFDINCDGKVENKNLHQTNYLNLLKGGNCMCSVSAMMKTKILNNLGGFDEQLFYEDLDIWLRISKYYPIKFIDQPLVKKRSVKYSQSSFFYKKNDYAKKINKSTFLILKKAFKMNTNINEHRALLKRVHHEIVHNFNLKNYTLVFKNFILKIKIHSKILFT